ncbi:RluA family pseudouridine synthase [Patescibacteria group bacterium]
MNMPIIYQDENILAVNKPAGLLVHSVSSSAEASQDEQKTLVSFLLKNYPEVKTVGDEPELRPGIVHRLDKETSGVLLVARNQESFEYLKEQFKNREVKKTYLALVKDNVKKNSGIIDTPIKRFTKSREAETKYKVVKKFDSYTLLEVYPKTGRTHQIRIHLKSIGHPIVCEKLYTKKPDCPFELTRHFLHAQSIELTLPDGTRMKLEADLPEDLKNVLDKLEKLES